VWIPILLATYPGYRLEHLLSANFTEISFLLKGLPHVVRYQLSSSPLVDRKSKRRLRPARFLDWFYPNKE